MKRVLVTGGCGFLGSHVVSILCDRDVDVLVYDDLSSCWMNEDNAPRFLDPRATAIDWMTDEPIACAGEVDALVHLAMRWPVEREKAVFEKVFEDFVVQGLNLVLGFSRFRRFSRVVVGSTVERTGPASALCASLQAALGYWHRPPVLGTYFVHLPELVGDRRLPEAAFPEGEFDTLPVEVAAKAIADLADGTARHRKGVDITLDGAA
jgi:nucleoside-diphosphate-sugar epimerase